MDVRESLRLMREYYKKTALITEDDAHDGAPITPDEYQTEIQKFNDGVVFTSREDFQPLMKYPDTVTWSGTVNSNIKWSYHVNKNKSLSNVMISIGEPIILDDATMNILNKLKSYFDTFYAYWTQNI